MPVNGSAYLYTNSATTNVDYYYSTDSTTNYPFYRIAYPYHPNMGWYNWDEKRGEYVPYVPNMTKNEKMKGDNEIIRD